MLEVVTRATSLSVLGALTAIGIFYTLCALGYRRNAFLVSLLGFFGTLLFPYSTLGVGALFGAPFISWGCYFLLKGSESRSSIIHAGFCFGFSFFCLNESAFVCLVAALYVLASSKDLKFTVWFCLAAGLFVLANFLYHLVAFGDLLHFPAAFTAPNGRPYPEGSEAAALRFAFPSFGKLGQMFFSSSHGIFATSPVLLLAFLGYWRLACQGEFVFSAFLFFAFWSFFGFFSVNHAWNLGANFGFRYIVPALPLLCIAAGAWFADRKVWKLEWLLFAPGVAICWFVASVSVWVKPSHREDPIFGYLMPIFLEKGAEGFINQSLRLVGVDNWYAHAAVPGLVLLVLAVVVYLHLRAVPK